MISLDDELASVVSEELCVKISEGKNKRKKKTIFIFLWSY
jgi:hypothetical protein